jgi:hypothetical protein
MQWCGRAVCNGTSTGGGFADVLPVFKNQEDWEGGANTWRGAGGPYTSADHGTLIQRRRLHQHKHRGGWDSG